MMLSLFNFLAMPWLMEQRVQEVDYSTFMSMTEEKNIGEVDTQDNQIEFTKENA